MKKHMRWLILGIVLVLLTAGAGCQKEETAPANPVVTITMDDGSQIKIELYPDVAPNTVNNFISLANSGYYDGVIFHRIIPGFVIQGGDPEGTGMGSPGYSIKGEFADNGVENNLSHTRGVISMARAGYHNDTAGSQFFIVVDDSAVYSLDGLYAGFGMVLEGMEVVDEIVSGPSTGGNEGMALEPRIMEKVEVDTFGVEYPEPEILTELS